MADEPVAEAIEKAPVPSLIAPATPAAIPPSNLSQYGPTFGPTPEMSGNMTFREMGQSGLRQFSGWVREEFLPNLVGRQGAQKYREMMDNSPMVGGLMFAVISTMRKVEWRVTPANDSPEAEEMAEFVESCMNDMGHTWEDLIAENLSMLGYGYAPHEIVYKRRLGRTPPADPEKAGKYLPKSNYDDGRIGWRKIPIRGQDTILKWFFGDHGDIMGLTQQPWIGPIVDVPIEKMLLFRPTAHKNNPEGRSILRSAYIPYYFCKRMQEQEAIVGERMGGVPVLSVPGALFAAAAGTGPDAAKAKATIDNYKKIVTNVRIDEQMGMLLPSDVYPGANGPSSVRMYEFALVTPQGRPMGGFAFDATINRYNLAILTSSLADFISMGHTTRGAQNLGETKVDMFFQAIEGFLNSIAAVYNRYGLPRLWDLNGLDPDLMPKLEPDLAQRIDLDALSNFVLRLAQAGMPLFPNEDLQTYILDAAGLPDVVDDNALRAAGLSDEQLEIDDAKAAEALLGMQQQNQVANEVKPATTNLQKMILASLARRVLKQQGPKFGVNTKKTRKRHSHRQKT